MRMEIKEQNEINERHLPKVSQRKQKTKMGKTAEKRQDMGAGKGSLRGDSGYTTKGSLHQD